MKWCLTLALLGAALPCSSAIVYTTLDEFEAAVGRATKSIDFSQEILPACADVDFYEAQREVIGNNCVASSTIVGGERVYTMRGHVWLDQIWIRSGMADGSTYGGGGYGAHLWNGPTTFLRADPVGGDRLAIEFYRPFLTLGVHTTDGFFGWVPNLPDEGLLILPAGAEITRLDYEFGPAALPTPPTLALVLSAVVVGGAVTRRRRLSVVKI